MTDLSGVRIDELIRNARVRGASDIHFGGVDRPAFRIDGRLTVIDGAPLTAAAVTRFLNETLTPAATERLDHEGTADGATHHPDAGPMRIHAYRQIGGIRVVVRLLAKTTPQLDSLHLPPVVATLASRPSGLVLFTGPTGCGKTTALAALIDRINRTSERNIITIEDPVEFIHQPLRSLITHCEIGRDVSGYPEALRGILRADPDVILVGEMRDRETMAAALTAAETGHLVFATLHTNDASQSVDRIVDAFNAEVQAQIRAQLASVILAVVSLRLLRRKSEPGRRAAAEILIATDAARNIIREGKTHQLRNAIVTGRNVGMQTLETHLSELVMRGEIDYAEAQAVSNRPEEIRALDRSAN
ncbi:MAG: type IV pilus twitching motility protein PilT [Candidatus Velthaea sp.]